MITPLLLALTATSVLAHFDRFVSAQSNRFGVKFLELQSISYLDASGTINSLSKWVDRYYKFNNGVIVNEEFESVLVYNKWTDEVGFILDAYDKVINPLKSNVNDANLQIFAMRYTSGNLQNELEDLRIAKSISASKPYRYKFDENKFVSESPRKSEISFVPLKELDYRDVKSLHLFNSSGRQIPLDQFHPFRNPSLVDQLGSSVVLRNEEGVLGVLMRNGRVIVNSLKTILEQDPSFAKYTIQKIGKLDKS